MINTVIIPIKVFVKSKKTKFYIVKCFIALTFIFKLRGVCNLRFHFLNYFFFKSIINKSLFLSSLLLASKRIPRGSGKVLLTTWVRTGYCWAHGCIPSLVILNYDISCSPRRRSKSSKTFSLCHHWCTHGFTQKNSA